MLGGAAIIGGQLRFARALGEALRVDQKDVHLGALSGSPAFQLVALLAQVLQFLRREVGRVAQPQVHIALFGLRNGAQAAHQEQAMQRRGALAATRFVDEGAGQSLDFGEAGIIRLKAAEAGRCNGRDIARQQWMIDVQQQWQQLEDQLLACGQRLHGPLQAALIDLQKARAQLRQHLAVDAVIDIGAYFLRARHARTLLQIRQAYQRQARQCSAFDAISPAAPFP